jgi:transcriptional regulator with XRE-family HTH domain
MVERVGVHIRTERARLGWSLEQLADASGVSRGWIGRLERGVADPTTKVVGQIAAALGVQAATLLGEVASPGDAAEPPVAVARSGRRAALRFPDSQHFFEILTPNLRGPLQVLLVDIQPDEPRPIEFFSHPGQEFFLVLAGEVVLEVEGQEVHLQPWDSATIASKGPHRLRNIGEGVAKVVTAATPPFL